MNQLLRQGDVLLKSVQLDLPAGLTAKADAAVAYGEFSGHAHVATGPNTHVFEWEGKTYVSVGADGGQLEHLHLPTGRQADHRPLVLSPGVYEVVHQNVYNPFTHLLERVRD